jgi:hypothetical protein
MENFKFMSFLLNRFVPRFLRFSVLCHLILFTTSVFAQSVQTIRQDIQGSTSQPSRHLMIEMLDTTDGYTGETGLTPTCTINRPSTSSFSSCGNAVTEVGNGQYRVALAPVEWENLGYGTLYVTGTGARPYRSVYQIIESGSMFKEGASLNKYPNDFTAGGWTTEFSSITSNSLATWDGYAIADTLTADGTTNRHSMRLGISVPRGVNLYYTAEVKAGTATNAWLGNWGLSTGVDLNFSTAVITPSVPGGSVQLLGWKVDRLPSSWYRVHLLINQSQADTSSSQIDIGIGNGTVGTLPPSFSSSGTLYAVRAFALRSEDVAPELINSLMRSLQSASTTTAMVLSNTESAASSMYVGREICFYPDHNASNTDNIQGVNGRCSCITSYDGSTKATVVSPALDITLSSSYKYRIRNLCLVNANVVSMATDSISAAAVSAAAAAKIGATVPTNINMGG